MMVHYLEAQGLAGMGAGPAPPPPASAGTANFREILDDARREDVAGGRRSTGTDPSERAPARDPKSEARVSERSTEDSSAEQVAVSEGNEVVDAPLVAEDGAWVEPTVDAGQVVVATATTAPVSSPGAIGGAAETTQGSRGESMSSPTSTSSTPVVAAVGGQTVTAEELVGGPQGAQIPVTPSDGQRETLLTHRDGTTGAAGPVKLADVSQAGTRGAEVPLPNASTGNVESASAGTTSAVIAAAIATPTKAKPTTPGTASSLAAADSQTAASPSEGPAISVFDPTEGEFDASTSGDDETSRFFMLDGKTKRDPVTPATSHPQAPETATVSTPPTSTNSSAMPSGAPLPDGAAPIQGTVSVDAASLTASTSRGREMVEAARVQPVITADLERGSELSEKLYRIVRKTVRDGGGELRLRLDPPELGRVDLDVKLRGDRVDIAFRVDDESVRSVILRDIEELHRALASYGIEADGVVVDLRDPGAGGRGDGDRQQATGGRTRGIEGTPESGEPAKVVVRSAHLGAQLDRVA